MAFIALALILLTSMFAFYSAFNKPTSAEAAALPVLYIDPANVVNPALVSGNTFTVDLRLANVTGMYGYQFTLTWNDSIINLVSVHDNVPLPPGYFLAQNTTSAGQMDFVVTSITSGYAGATGSFDLRTIVFKVAGTGSTVIAITNDVLGDPSANAIPHNAINGYFSNTPVVPTKFQLTISVSGSGVTNPVAGKYLYDKGTQVPVTATANSGFSFDHWMLDNVNSGSASPFTVTMNANHTLEAFFVEVVPVKFQLTINVIGNGTTTPTPGTYMYDAGAKVNVTAIADSGWLLQQWILDGQNKGVSNPYSLTMNANHTLTAEFKIRGPVIPEFWLGPILGIVGCFAALALFKLYKSKPSKIVTIAQ